MKTCERLVKEGRFIPSNPVGVLTTSYYELLQNKVPLLGEHIQFSLSGCDAKQFPCGLNPNLFFGVKLFFSGLAVGGWGFLQHDSEPIHIWLGKLGTCTVELALRIPSVSFFNLFSVTNLEHAWSISRWSITWSEQGMSFGTFPPCIITWTAGNNTVLCCVWNQPFFRPAVRVCM